MKSKFVGRVNEVKNLEAVFLDYSSPKPPFFIGWKDILDKILEEFACWLHG
jgi:hypothetical protein